VQAAQQHSPCRPVLSTAAFSLRREYTDKAGRKHDKHPVYDYYIGAMFMDLGGYAQLKAIAAARPPSAEEVRPVTPTRSLAGSPQLVIQTHSTSPQQQEAAAAAQTRLPAPKHTCLLRPHPKGAP
jgi:hypothetical protein